MTYRKLLSSGVLVVATALPVVAQTRIQPPTLRPTEQPAISPYLLLGPNSIVFQRELNYFTQRRNERRIDAVNRQLRVETRRLDSSIEEIQNPTPVLPTRPLSQSDTGHSTSFYNTYNYFPTRNRR